MEDGDHPIVWPPQIMSPSAKNSFARVLNDNQDHMWIL